MTAEETCKEIASRLFYLFGHMDGTFDPPALKEIFEMANEAYENYNVKIRSRESQHCMLSYAKALTVLTEFQRWRRALGDYSKAGVECPYDATTVGVALDTAMHLLSKHTPKNKHPFPDIMSRIMKSETKKKRKKK